MKPFLLILSILVQSFYAQAQNTLSGIVIDAADNQAVPYVSIGVTSTPDGTVSDVAGLFRITLDNQVTDYDTLKFSSIGYESKIFLIGELRERFKRGPLTIALKKSITLLKPITVASTKGHVKIAGYDKNSKLFGLGFDASGVGSQAGVIIPISHKETNIQNLSFFIIQNPFRHLLFRMNLYQMVDGKPGNNLMSENVLITIDNNQTGKVIFDLSRYNLYVDGDALLTLEWLDAQPATGAKLAVAAAVFGHSYYRQASQSAWIKKGTGIGLSVKTVY